MIASYPHLKLVDIRVPLDGETAMLSSGFTVVAHGFVGVYPVVKPANAYNFWNLEDLKIPEGYEPDGESLKDAFRTAKPGELYLSRVNGTVLMAADADWWYTEDTRRLCVRKIKPKTKRVLVVEYDNPTQALEDFAQMMCPTEKDNSSARRIRIEERPL